MRHALVLTVMLCAGCEATISGGGNVSGVDASPGDDDVDAPIGIDATICNPRSVYLSFEGEPLTKANQSNSKLNRASWMTNASGTAPRYHAGSANRLTEIQAVVDGVKAQLAPFPITVVTTRPAGGDYVMIVFGGASAPGGSIFNGAVQELDCGDTNRNDVGWVADNVTPTQKVVNFTVGAIGFGLGLTATSSTTDCMCGWDNACISNNNQACTLTEGITRDPAANQKCAGVSSQDEASTFAAAFCQ